MRPNNSTKLAFSPLPNRSRARAMQPSSDNANKPQRDFEHVRDSMHSAISMNKTEVIDTVLNDFSEGYFSLCYENRRRLLLVLAKEYDLNRTQVCELIKQYLGGEEAQSAGHEEDGVLGSFYRIERNLRHALKPMYEGLFERLNMHPGGLKVLTSLRADILSILAEENIASLRALDSYLKEKLGTWLSPAALELHQITWDDPASLLEKIVAYEEVLWDDPPIPECEATCALFYSISSTQRGLAGINLGKFLIKRVITLVKRDMPHISTFATISPIPGFIQWLLSKLASQSKLAEVNDISQSSADRSGSAFRENILEPEEEKALMDLSEEFVAGKNGMERMLNLLTSKNHEWSNFAPLLSILKTPLLRLCARYLLQEKKRGKALDSVANFHLQNGAMIERINWMADRSENGLHQSAGIMVNYVYRLENIEEYAQSYFSTGQIHASDDVCRYVEPLNEHQPATDKRG
ncbi:Malonyl-CoA decarboxylase family protein [Citrus sinensis]|nr:Malonyl-CoA decarboxylase family protein [Citrus sinensis]